MNSQQSSMRGFLILWYGQLVSIVGTGMTQFALAIWIWKQTGQVTPVVLTATFYFAPTVFIAPFLAAFIDRWSRKRLLLACDLIGGCVSLLLCLLCLTGSFQVGYLYLAALLTGTFQSLQGPTLMAAVSTLVTKENYARAAGLLGLSDNMGQILAPALGSLVYALVSIQGIFDN